MNTHHQGKGADVSRWFMIGTCVLMILSASAGHAETYIAGQVGFTLAQDTTRGRVNDPTYSGFPTGTSISNVGLNNSIMYGMKVGHYFGSVPWLGVELEGFVTTPHRPQQRLTLGVPGSGNVTLEEGGATNRFIVVSPVLLARYQAGAFEPYVGVGPGLFMLHQKQLTSAASGTAYSQSYTGIGLNTQVGLRYRLTDHVSMFGEWKFNYARLNLPGQADVNHFGINAIATLHHFVFGVAYHF
ncbi:MAG: OmpW family outer membrane protein [Nitrospira sp.]|nr:OmpW family outer membrane protein [Nitrospira sp.]